MSEDSIIQAYNSLRASRVPWEGWWERLRHYVLPGRPGSGEEHIPADESSSVRHLSDTTAVEACQKLASAHMSYMTPSHELWFKWDSPTPAAGDEAQSWYNRCSEIANRELALSNFYTALHECFLDRVGLGTGSLFCGTTRGGRLFFRHIPCGQFVCAENDEGVIDTYMREFMFSPHQAESQFGLRALGPRAKAICAKAEDVHTPCLRFLHAVRPREKRNRSRHTGRDMAWQSVYYSLDDHSCVEEGGYREMPYMVTRFLKWGESPYGLSPARLVYPDIERAQFLNKILDMLGEVAAFPRILELANQVGEVDLRAGGRTLINPESASLGYPREWATQGRYDVGMDRLRQKQESINRAFFIPMLELWSERKQQMTAAEVYARENERVMLFSPSFTLFSSDFQPLMERVFSLLFRLGRFPKPPAGVLQGDAQGELYVAEPHVIYQGRIAMIMRRIQSEGMERTLNRLQSLAALEPSLIDHVDLDASFRMAARLDGVPEQVLRPEARVRRMRREREQAGAAAQEVSSEPEGDAGPALSLPQVQPTSPSPMP